MPPSRIFEHIFLGDYQDATRFTGRRLCVLEQRPEYPPRLGDRWIPILEESRWGRTRANRDKLDEAAAWVADRIAAKDRALVHCMGGIERSPLVMAWYLHRRHGLTLDGAYAQLRWIRPEVQLRHEMWL